MSTITLGMIPACLLSLPEVPLIQLLADPEGPYIVKVCGEYVVDVQLSAVIETTYGTPKKVRLQSILFYSILLYFKILNRSHGRDSDAIRVSITFPLPV